MNLKLVFSLLIVSISLIECLDQEYFDKYKGYSVYKITYKRENDLKILNSLKENFKNEIEYWNEPNKLRNWLNMMVKSDLKQVFEETLVKYRIDYEVTIDDVGTLIEKQLSYKLSQTANETFNYSKYHTLDEINQWMVNLQKDYPQFVTILNITRSYENRDIYAIKISIPNQRPNKKAIWYDGGIHAREWISPATVIYIAHNLLINYGIDYDITAMMNAIDFYILPVFNVDGYVYTWTKDRNWRKTRSKTFLPFCTGVDPNRNWDSHFGGGGTSKDPCSDSYCGSHPFSEPETKGVSDFLAQHNDTIVCYINFHSYSQLWMSPWGWTTDKPANYTLQDNGSKAAVESLARRYGTSYQHGNIASTIYVASGSSVDWTYEKANIFFSYAVELRDQGQYGFLLPESEIEPSGLETFDAIKSLTFYILNFYV